MLSTDTKNHRASDGYVEYNKIRNLLIIFIITVAAGRILMLQLQLSGRMLNHLSYGTLLYHSGSTHIGEKGNEL